MLSTLMRSARVHWISSRHLGLRRSPIPRPIPSPLCSICDKPVPLETCKTNEAGKAVHGECYVLKLKQAATHEQRMLARREA
jgi:hypothetical protein